MRVKVNQVEIKMLSLKQVIIITSIFITSSCGLINWSAEFDSSRAQNFSRKKTPSENLVCHKDQEFKTVSNFQFYSNSQVTTEIFESFYQRRPFNNYTQEELLVSFILLHFITRPDLIAPNSRLQNFSINHKSHQEGLRLDYQDWSHASLQDSLLVFLEQYLASRPSRSLMQIARNIDRFMPSSVQIESEFEQFLQNNSDQILANPMLSALFSRGNQILRVGESFSPFNLEESIKQYRQIVKQEDHSKNNKTKSLRHLFGPFSESGELKFLNQIGELGTQSIFCNFDLSLYSQGIFLPGPHSEHTALEIGIFNREIQKSNLVTITTSNIKRKLNRESNLLLAQVKSQKNAQKASFCHSLNLITQTEMIISSSRSRDPGQVLGSFLKKDIFEDASLDNLKNHLNLARTIKLSRPLRILYEESRGDSEKLQQLYHKNLPVYYSPKIGSLHIHLLDPSTQYFGPILDNRWDMSLKCID